MTEVHELLRKPFCCVRLSAGCATKVRQAQDAGGIRNYSRSAILRVYRRIIFSPHFHYKFFPFQSIFCIGIFFRISDGVAQEQMAFAFRVGVFAIHCDMRVARLPDTSVVHLLEIGSAEMFFFMVAPPSLSTFPESWPPEEPARISSV